METEQASNILRSIPILHVHGTLGAHPYTGDDSIRDYSDQFTIDDLQTAANSIVIVGEADTNSSVFEDARKKILEARIICFLGFGFDKTNLLNLHLEEAHLHNSLVFGTAYKLGGGKVDELFTLLPLNRKCTTFKPFKARELLHEHNILSYPWEPGLNKISLP